ncbi:DUF4435 domain-containing protein [Hyalangium minutum]|uniref:DUF4435 domain-containing protein n=1 Tax=Hyalangium minutum TaxID=394096 RepID=UPI00094AE65A|nr:DUF4435 domain-containing protein [Hyalangium minutum]
MTFPDQLQQSMQRSVVILHRFLLNVGKLRSGVHAFFEGKTDDSFYGTAIRSHLDPDRKYATYHCGSKRRVHDVRKEINGRVPRGSVALFFTDRDLDRLIPVVYDSFDDVYVTDFYSVENHLVSEEMLECVWGQVFRQELDPASMTPVMEKFREGMAKYCSTMRYVMAWVVVQRRAGTKLNLDDKVSLHELFEVGEDLVASTKIADGDVYKALDSMARCVTNEEQKAQADALAAQFVNEFPKNFVRGRFELWFFMEFLKSLRKWSERQGYRVQAKVELGLANALDVLGPRVRLPISLATFLRRHLGKAELPGAV